MSKFNFNAWIKKTRETWLEEHEIDLKGKNLRVGQKPQKKDEETIRRDLMNGLQENSTVTKPFCLGKNQLNIFPQMKCFVDLLLHILNS